MELTSGHTQPEGLDALIEALTILRKYDNPKYPTICEHDMMIVCISPELVSPADKDKLDSLGFHVDEELDSFSSYKFGFPCR